MIRRYLIVVGAILAVLVGGLWATKPKPGELKREVDRAMAAYAKAQAEAPEGALRDVAPLKIVKERDWILARSYGAEQDGQSFWCWGVSLVTVCGAPD